MVRGSRTNIPRSPLDCDAMSLAATTMAARMSVTSSMEFEIPDVRALVRRPEREQAQRLLERIAAQVLPILTKRRFRVRRLREFFPKDARLLGMNVNRGATIYIRLRPASRPMSFFPYEALLETMLHELTHMVHGLHNQVFYKYLDGLKDEMEWLMMRGLVGREGARFQDAGQGYSIQTESRVIAVRHENDNRAAVLAAKRREKYQRLLGGVTSQRVGGKTHAESAEHLTPHQLRARALEAAERRRRDNEACAITAGLSDAILGIDDSDEEDGDSTDNATERQRDNAMKVDEGIDYDRATAYRKPPGEVQVVDLLDESDDEIVSRPIDGRKDKSPDIIDLTDTSSTIHTTHLFSKTNSIDHTHAER